MSKFVSSKGYGLGLFALGTTSLIYFYSWWFQNNHLATPLFLVGFLIALFYGVFQVAFNWVLYLGVKNQSTSDQPTTENLSIDVFITAYNEDFDLIVGCLAAACSMKGNFKVWLLDDGNDDDLAKIAARFGAGYFSRKGNKDAKAGNMNAALPHTNGDIIAIFDVDHLPKEDFLTKTISYFSDPNVGFVQAIPTFYNRQHFGWVARAAAETTIDFYTSTSRGMDGFKSVTKIGTNSLIRRTALKEIGDYQPGLAEDLATSIELHAAGWSSRYVYEPLAPGLAPRDLTAWYTQQLKWARGVFEVLLTSYPRLFLKLSSIQRVVYAVRTTKYLVGSVIAAHLLLIISVLLKSDHHSKVILQSYLLHLAPLAIMDCLIRGLTLNKWGSFLQASTSLWRATILVLNTWPIYLAALLMSLFRIPLRFLPTPKSNSKRLNPLWVIPQIGTGFLLLVGLYLNINTGTFSNISEFWLLYLIAIAFAFPQLGLLWPLAISIVSQPEEELNPDEFLIRSSLTD